MRKSDNDRDKEKNTRNPRKRQKSARQPSPQSREPEATVSAAGAADRLPERVVWFILLGLVAVGAWFRFSRLGEVPMRGDTIEYLKVARSATSVFDVSRAAAAHSMAPCPIVLVRLLIDVFRLDVSFFSVRLPSVLIGLASIPVIFLAGRRLGGPLLGLTAAMLLAISPVHIQCSREAYPYIHTVLGAALMLYGIVWMWDAVRERSRLSWGFYAVVMVGLYLLIYATVSARPTAVWTAGVLGVAALCLGLRLPRNWLPLAVLVVVFGAISWSAGYAMLAAIMKGSVETGQKAVWGSGIVLFDWQGLWAFTDFAFGRTWPRVAFLVLTAALAVWAVWRRRRDAALWAVVLSIPAIFFAVMVGRYYSNTPYMPRFAICIMPFYLLFLALGLAQLGKLLVSRCASTSRAGLGLQLVPAVIASLFLLPASWLCTRMSGKPTPYREIIAWADANLPSQTPVLVDRWLEPANELAIHGPTNVNYTFTVPNEPVQRFLQIDWRNTAIEFFDKYPDAAYLEICKRYWDKPEVGRWQWPRDHFKHRVAFTNEAGLRLREMGLAYRKHFYHPNTNGLIVELFYNNPEDVVAAARDAGEKLLVLYGAGWGYGKTQGFRDWRILGDRAELMLYNLTSAPVNAGLRIEAVAAGGAKAVSIDGQSGMKFPANRPVGTGLGTFMLPPGERRLLLRDPGWGTMAQTPLLVQTITLYEEAP